VLVALGIVAIALMAGLQATTALTRNAQRQSDIVLAQLCAENELVKARLSRQMPGVGDSTEPCEQAGRRFDVSRDRAAHAQPEFSARGCPGAGWRHLGAAPVHHCGAVLIWGWLPPKGAQPAFGRPGPDGPNAWAAPASRTG
jgi:type II secretion system protein I